MKDANELLEVIRPTIVEVWTSGRNGVAMDFSDVDAFLKAYTEGYRCKRGRAPSERELRRYAIIVELLAQVYAAGVAAREAVQS